MRDLLWVLDQDGVPVPCADHSQWGDFMAYEFERRQVAEDIVSGVRVSTVFIGVNYQTKKGAPPLLFETKTFGSDHFMECRASTREEALENHKRVVTALGEMNG